MSHDRDPSRAALGFTLVEAIVVVVIISVLAGVAIPRMMSRNASGAKREIEAVQALVSAAARRDVLTSQLVALRYDSETQKLSVLTLADEDEKKPRGDDLWPWREDRLIPAVELSEVTLERTTTDEVAQDEDEWLIEMLRGVRRPDLLLEFADKQERSWFVYLPSKSGAAAAWTGEADQVERMAIDLDDEGRGNREW